MKPDIWLRRIAGLAFNQGKEEFMGDDAGERACTDCTLAFAQALQTTDLPGGPLTSLAAVDRLIWLTGSGKLFHAPPGHTAPAKPYRLPPKAAAVARAQQLAQMLRAAVKPGKLSPAPRGSYPPFGISSVPAPVRVARSTSPVQGPVSQAPVSPRSSKNETEDLRRQMFEFGRHLLECLQPNLPRSYQLTQAPEAQMRLTFSLLRDGETVCKFSLNYLANNKHQIGVTKAGRGYVTERCAALKAITQSAAKYLAQTNGGATLSDVALADDGYYVATVSFGGNPKSPDLGLNKAVLKTVLQSMAAWPGNYPYV